jgi:hypothetical protein
MGTWSERLSRVTAYEAFRLIWDPKRPLDLKQRKALEKFYTDLHDSNKIKEQQKLAEEWGRPEKWKV